MRPRARDRLPRRHLDGRRRSAGRRRGAGLLAMRSIVRALGLVALLALPAAASEWGQIKPAVSTQSEVRARYGAPSRETAQKIESYDTLQWVYEGAQAPKGIAKMIVDFGILTPAGYRTPTRRPCPRAWARTASRSSVAGRREDPEVDDHLRDALGRLRALVDPLHGVVALDLLRRLPAGRAVARAYLGLRGEGR